ncbi:hypothetical protein PN492_16610 [Dolichospermum circinale CS-537/01]|uniref:Uncharacterized protein n=2 Tax=Dolichospermum circinale TaxID=109265 RepID=A0ABT5A868_9CYAN|nr:hypothetical protein [Dolichospermum circinale]MDB9488150.1 hypothetical protein [Dolichospermum circinale CS-537/01]
MTLQSLHLLLGKLFALIIFYESKENNCYYLETDDWKKYQHSTNEITLSYIISRAEKLILEKQIKDVFYLLKEISIMYSNLEIPTRLVLVDSHFKMGLWSNLPDDENYILLNDIQEENQYSDSYEELPDHGDISDYYGTLVDDGQYY